jgi:hypothetical protein
MQEFENFLEATLALGAKTQLNKYLFNISAMRFDRKLKTERETSSPSDFFGLERYQQRSYI